MRACALALGCVVSLSLGQVAAAEHLYRFDFQFSKLGADAASFQRDSNRCVQDTSTPLGWRLSFISSLGGNTPASWQEVSRYANSSHPIAFYRCMSAKGYQTDPNGPFKASLRYWA